MDNNSDSLNIIYEDNHLIVVEKPVNVLSQKDITNDRDMLDILKDYLKVCYQKPGNVFVGLVHRLDRPVGGVMVFAKTSKAASRLSEQIRQRNFDKIYTAVVHGNPDKKHGSLKDYLLKDEKTNLVRVVPPGTEGSKEALLDYEVISTISGFSLVKVRLHTGRPHQIRVQMKNAGYPLYGDQKYAVGLSKPGQQIALWSSEIKVQHPTSKQEMVFRCPPPDTLPWIWFK